MDGFQSLRCLWKRLNKLVQSIMFILSMYWYVWIYMGIYGYVSVYICMCGYIWVYTGIQVLSGGVFLELQGVFFEFDFWLLKISKLNFESEFPLLGGSIL